MTQHLDVEFITLNNKIKLLYRHGIVLLYFRSFIEMKIYLFYMLSFLYIFRKFSIKIEQTPVHKTQDISLISFNT